MKKITRYFRGVGQEAKRVRWPHRKQLWTSVGVVLVITVISALVLYFEDWISSNILKSFENIKPSTDSSDSQNESLANLHVIFNFIGGLFR